MAEPDLSKLTVPQLKALCKERRITGYSKLSKAALLQRLAPTSVPTDATHREEPITRPTLEVTTELGRRKTSCEKLAHIDTSVPSKRIRTSATNASDEPMPQEKLAVDSVFKVPKVPVQPQRSLQATLTKQPTIKRSAVSRQNTGAGRFKPLVPLTSKPAQPTDPTNGQALVSVDLAVPPPALSQITFPPKASERKWVYWWAIILSALSPADRQTCTLVSRTFRYAVYLSATHILSSNYAGRRLDTLLEQHPSNMTNFWPYLRFRMAEISKRRHAFKQSFLGRYTNSLGYEPLSARLWTSPDDEKQVDIALRFVLTRMWFAASVGAYGHDASAWSKSVVQDVREIVKGEIWQVFTRHRGTGETCSFYVLEATCEVVGQSLSSQHALEYSLRADWTTWISQRSQAPLDAGPRSLMECVKWSNTEDYHQGISKAWLRRVQEEDADSVAKKSVAERYILASVVANGISGQWMSTSAMAQECAGLASMHNSKVEGRSMHRVNMYLGDHHHVESVHFTTMGKSLHGAVAVIQTPGREYYILRDNGMQVGCEEEGIPTVWQHILGCDTLGNTV